MSYSYSYNWLIPLGRAAQFALIRCREHWLLYLGVGLRRKFWVRQKAT